MSNIKQILAKRLKECRKDLKMTQMQVSIQCDISERAYQNYELMLREPKLEILLRIADCYKVSIDYLVGRTDIKNIS
ncbi:MAG: helix-turn-helix transcriptional regulator [bacterium]